jgi:hypothetical protein
LTLAGGALVAILLAIAALHFYWGVGGVWPGTDSETLRQTVVGTASGPMYGFLACAIVAGALASAAAVVVVRHSGLMGGPLRFLVLAGYVVLILVFAMRGIAPYVTPVFEYARGRPFFELNLWLYAPLCLAIATLLLLDFPRGRSGGAA